MGKIYMTACMKGGCAKTVTTYNLAYSLQKLGKKVLAVDFDSQANLTTCFGVEDPAAVPVTIGHLMMAKMEDEELPEAEEYICSRNGVDFIPSSMILSAVCMERYQGAYHDCNEWHKKRGHCGMEWYPFCDHQGNERYPQCGQFSMERDPEYYFLYSEWNPEYGIRCVSCHVVRNPEYYFRDL